ncbi:MAG: hypothetical protein GX638_10595 [Crenarchaeota archaeon]|nr:hypothetical protein [Thermoproteota archaeon]
MKGIGAILGLFILVSIISNIIGSHDTSIPTSTGVSNIGTKIAYTRDGQNFVSKERVEENIKYFYAKPGDYREVQVPLNTVVVGASVIPGISEPENKVTTTTRTSLDKRTKASEQKDSAEDKEWANNVLATNTAVSQEFEILSKAAANYQFDEIKNHCSSLMPIVDDALKTSKNYEVSSQYQASKNSYELAMQEFYDGCNDALNGINTMDANTMNAGKKHIMNGKTYLDKSINLLPQ